MLSISIFNSLTTNPFGSPPPWQYCWSLRRCYRRHWLDVSQGCSPCSLSSPNRNDLSKRSRYPVRLLGLLLFQTASRLFFCRFIFHLSNILQPKGPSLQDGISFFNLTLQRCDGPQSSEGRLGNKYSQTNGGFDKGSLLHQLATMVSWNIIALLGDSFHTLLGVIHKLLRTHLQTWHLLPRSFLSQSWWYIVCMNKTPLENSCLRP